MLSLPDRCNRWANANPGFGDKAEIVTRFSNRRLTCNQLKSAATASLSHPAATPATH